MAEASPTRTPEALASEAAAFYDELASLVYGIARSVIAEPRAAEGLTRDVLLELWDARGHVESGVSRVQAASLAHRRAVESARASGVDTAAERGVPSGPADRPEVIARVLGRLSDHQRDILVLAYYHGLTRRAIARRLELSPKVVARQLRRALRHVAREPLLEDRGDPHEETARSSVDVADE